MAPIVSAMQYFAETNPALKDELLFYLVTEVFAQCLSSFDSSRIYDRVEDEGYAVEHVLTYSGTVLQVPYNQQLGPLSPLMPTDGRNSTGKTVLEHGGTERKTE
jgi:hypothetical protein